MSAFFSLIVALFLVPCADGPTVVGTVRATDTGAGLGGVLVDASERNARTWSDSAGNYVLALPRAGQAHLRFLRIGYRSVDLDVEVPDTGAVRLDVWLQAQPVPLSRLVVRRLGMAQVPERTGTSSGSAEVGVTEISIRQLRLEPGSVPGEILASLAGRPGITAPGGATAFLHVQGGPGDQNAFFFDGIPVYGAVHGARPLLAIDPDAVSSITLHALAPPVTFGGGASSVVQVTTLDPASVSPMTAGALDGGMVRALVQRASPGERIGFVLGGRSTYPAFWAGQGNGAPVLNDVLGKLVWAAGTNRFEWLSLRSRDATSFSAANRFAHTSATDGVSWTASRRGIRARIVLWRGAEAAALHWSSTAGEPLQVASRTGDTGGRASLTRERRDGEESIGVGLERLSTEYSVQSGGSTGGGTAASLGMKQRPLVFSAFLERRWKHTRWGAVTGLRLSGTERTGWAFSPRLSFRYAIAPRLELRLGWSQLEQHQQSLANEESLAQALVGLNLPVAAGGSIPLARSQQLGLETVWRVDAHTTVSAAAYTRALKGLVLVAPTTGAPFATEQVGSGAGTSRGLDIAVKHRADTWMAQVMLGTYTNWRSDAGTRYRPSFDGRRMASAGVAWWFGPASIRAAFRISDGRVTSPVQPGFEWSPFSPWSGNGDMVGTPWRADGPLNAVQVPLFEQLDAGVERSWSFQVKDRPVRVDLGAYVLNVLDRANVLGYVSGSDGRFGTINLLPRSLRLALTWRF